MTAIQIVTPFNKPKHTMQKSFQQSVTNEYISVAIHSLKLHSEISLVKTKTDPTLGQCLDNMKKANASSLLVDPFRKDAVVQNKHYGV